MQQTDGVLSSGEPYFCRCGVIANVQAPASSDGKVSTDCDFKEGEKVALHLVGEKSFEVVKKPTTSELLARLRNLRGRLPADFHFDRLEANEAG